MHKYCSIEKDSTINNIFAIPSESIRRDNEVRLHEKKYRLCTAMLISIYKVSHVDFNFLYYLLPEAITICLK